MKEEKSIRDNNQLRITAVRPLNPRSLRLEFSNGEIRLFDSHRLRGPKFIPLMNPDYFKRPVLRNGGLGWEELEVTLSARYIYDRSVPYDDNAVAREYVPTRKEIIGERVATVLFPLMAIAGTGGIVWWYIHH